MPKSPYAKFGSSTITGTQTQQPQHVVKGGDTIPAIAATEYSEGYDAEHWRQLAEGNGITDLDAVAVGQVLVVIPLQPPST